MLRKLKGFDLHGILKLSMPQFYYLLQSISKEIEEENKRIRKSYRKK